MQGKENKSDNKQFVSPIKIKNNKIIKQFDSSKLNPIYESVTNCSKKTSLQGISSNLKNYNSVKKNLNVHFISDNDGDDEFPRDESLEILNYSIVKESNEHEMNNCNSIKIKLRKSSRKYVDTLNDKDEKNENIKFCEKVDNSTKKYNGTIVKDSSEKYSKSTQQYKYEFSRNNILKSSNQNEQYDPKILIQDNDSSIKAEVINREKTKKHNSNLPKIINDIKIEQDTYISKNSIFSLPCRENEYENIYNFLKDKIQNKMGGCIYISGVPGTGKTETVISVIKHLKNESKLNLISEFDYIEINGMKLTEPRQAYVQIYKQLHMYDKIKNESSITWKDALVILEKRYNSVNCTDRRNVTVLLVDELDSLCNRRQDVIYNLLDWPTKYLSNLIVVTIANTMDLPERILKVKITSRLGLTRLTFLPYTYRQLQKIIMFKLKKSELLNNDAIEFLARKVAAVSGDARRALHICKKTIENYENDTFAKNTGCIQMIHVQQAISEMTSNTKVQAIKNCSLLEKILLQAIVSEMTRTGVEETIFHNVYIQMKSILTFMGMLIPCIGNVLRICSKLNAERLLLCEHSRMDLYQKILLNVSIDDVYYATKIESV